MSDFQFSFKKEKGPCRIFPQNVQIIPLKLETNVKMNKWTIKFN